MCVCFSEQQQRVGVGEYNFGAYDFSSTEQLGTEQPFIEWTDTTGTDWATYTEAPGMSAFVREDGAVYHNYSAYAP